MGVSMKRISYLFFLLFAGLAWADVRFDNSAEAPWSIDAEMDFEGDSVLRTGSIFDGVSTSITLTFTDVSSVELYIKTEASCISVGRRRLDFGE